MIVEKRVNDETHPWHASPGERRGRPPALTFVSTDIPSLPPSPQDERHKNKKPSDCMTAHGSDLRVAPGSSSLLR